MPQNRRPVLPTYPRRAPASPTGGTIMLDSAATTQSLLLADLWDAVHAAALSPPELLLYRSNLLGRDKRITNYGGGNTSAKIVMRDPLTGEAVDVLWVKGSGGDLGSM